MTAPRWISEAFDAARPEERDMDADDLSAALIERLPLEAMTAEIRVRCADYHRLAEHCPDTWPGDDTFPLPPDVSAGIVARIAGVLSDGDPEVVELAKLYQGACRALDAAGVPYAIDVEPDHLKIEAVPGELTLHKPVETEQVPSHSASQLIDLAGRIRWLAQQRPTRLDLERVEAERDLARTMHQDAERAFRLQALEIAATDRQVLRAKIADQDAYIEQLEVEIDALEDDIWQDEP